MEIRGIQPSRTIGIKDKVVSNKSGFSENFMKSYKSATKEELENYIKDIKKKGNTSRFFFNIIFLHYLCMLL